MICDKCGERCLDTEVGPTDRFFSQTIWHYRYLRPAFGNAIYPHTILRFRCVVDSQADARAQTHQLPKNWTVV